MRLLLVLLITFSVSAQKLHKFVNPFIGTGGHGHTFPGATLPHGMVQLSPDTRIDGSWDGCGGYHYSDNIIYGFSHTHLSGTGVSDFGDIMLMPTMGKASLDKKEYSSKFSHQNEKASAGYYSVLLEDDDILAELTASTRVGFHRYTFNKGGKANIILDLNHRDKLLQGEVRIIDSKTIEVLRRSEAWARDQYVYARIEFSRPMVVSSIANNGVTPAKTTDTFFAGSILALSFSTDVKKNERIQVKVALSPTSYSGAQLNMGEIKGWDFLKVKSAAESAWDLELRKIIVTDPDKDKMSIFYTALYHTMIQPNIAQDLDRKYRGRDNKIYTADGFDYYTVFSLWDTFRAAHPLYTIIDKKRTADYINTFIKQYEQGGRLPVWELASNETDCMIGYHSVSVIADAVAKNIPGFNIDKAYEAAKHSAMLDHLGLDAYKRQGFISIDDEHESVSKTLEYAYDDWCIAQLALKLNRMDDYRLFMRRSQSWKNLLDPVSGFMRPRRNGGWDSPFDPREVNNNFTEGNSWQYSFFVPHDIPGMIAAYGGNIAFEHKLDALFSAPTATTGREQVDITGLIGQYAHGNEPSHHMAFLYNYVGKPQKAEAKISSILNDFYKNTPDGLIGNEDCGQMSAWYVLTSLGFYFMSPGDPSYTTVKPLFNSYKINLENGSVVTSASELGFKSSEQKPASENIVPVPVIHTEAKSFRDKASVSVSSPLKNAKVYYKINKGNKFMEYASPFYVTESAVITAYAKDGTRQSSEATARIFKKQNDYKVTIKGNYNKQYHAGGPEGLVDGITGSENWRKGDWQGYQGQDFEAVIDMGSLKNVKSVAASFLQDSRSWILFPLKLSVMYSLDNFNFYPLGSLNAAVDSKNYDVQLKKLVVSKEVSARYLKVTATNFGILPEHHQGAGSQAFIFIDEIYID